MKKRSLFTLVLVALLAFSLGMGTLAYYSNTFVSNDNFVRAAAFKVDTKGILNEELEFDLTGDPLIPGKTKDLYEFVIDKTGTEVPVKYGVTVKGKEDLFKGKTPVKLNLYREIEGVDTLCEEAEFVATKDEEYFRIEAVWDHSNNDTAYQDKIGKVAIKVVATQVDDDNMPGGSGSVDPYPGSEVDAEYVYANFIIDKGTWMKVYVKKIDGASRVKVKYHNGQEEVTTDIFKTGAIYKFSNSDNMPESINILVYNDESDEPLYEFKNIQPQRKNRL